MVILALIGKFLATEKYLEDYFLNFGMTRVKLLNSKGIVNPNSKIWFILMFVIGFFRPWFGVYLYSTFQHLSLSDFMIKIVFMACTITVIFMTIRTVMILGNQEFKNVLFGGILTTLSAISFVIALVIYLGM